MQITSFVKTSPAWVPHLLCCVLCLFKEELFSSYVRGVAERKEWFSCAECSYLCMLVAPSSPLAVGTPSIHLFICFVGVLNKLTSFQHMGLTMSRVGMLWDGTSLWCKSLCFLEVVQAKTQGCKLGAKDRVL